VTISDCFVHTSCDTIDICESHVGEHGYIFDAIRRKEIENKK
jgi:hypothetical protein